MSIADDPGSLDPQVALSGTIVQLNAFAYDTLVGVDPDGTILPQLASSWTVKDTKVSFEILDGVTCSDGTPFTADTVVANLSFALDPKNQSQYLGVYVPAGATVKASGSTVKLTLAAPSPFVLNGLARYPMVCDTGLNDRDLLQQGSAGTGPYVLEKAVSGDRYEYQLREGYTWGPDGATTEREGLPETVTVRVLPNETTAANELISGSLNAAQILGPDRDRLVAADIDYYEQPTLTGLQWFNHQQDHVTSDPAIRRALSQALDVEELRQVLTAGRGSAPTQLAVSSPSVCEGDDSVSGAVPEFDADAAGQALDEAGWTMGSDGYRSKDGKRLSITFGYATLLGAQAGSTAELAVQQWQEVGIEAKSKQLSQTEWSALFGTGDWDVLWLPASTNSPDQLAPLLSGANPPDGNNFSFIDNDDYTTHVAAGMAQAGADGCSEWMAAESALFEESDIFPFANDEIATFGKSAEFEMSPGIVPTSITMLG